MGSFARASYCVGIKATKGMCVQQTTDNQNQHLENTPNQPVELQRAVAHLETGRYKEAALVLQGWLIDNPQDARAYALLAQVQSLDKQDGPAWVALSTALSINPALSVVQRNHARLLLKQQKLNEALQAAQAAYQSDPADPENQLVLASALGANNQNEQAFQLLDIALQSRPNYAEAFANRALLKLRGKDFAGALADAEKALFIKPHLGQLWGIVGALRYQFKNLLGAVDALEKALDLDPDNVGHMVNLGEFKRQAGALEAAIILLERATTIAPDNVAAWVNLGTVLQESRRMSEAKTAYANALELAPGKAEIASNLGALAMYEEDLEEALRYFKQAVASKPDFAEAHNNLGATLIDLGRLDEAEASCQVALSIKPEFAGAYQNLAVALHGLGRLDVAISCAKRSLELKPDGGKVLYLLHSLLLDPANIALSIEYMRQAVAIQPENKKFRFFLGLLLDYTGDDKAAASHFDLVSAGSRAERALLDAWEYLKSASIRRPLIIGSSIQSFQLGINSANSTGLVMEFGVRHGTAIRQIASLVGSQEIHGFDSFEGLPEDWGNKPHGSYSTGGVVPDVPENVILHKGWFEDTIPSFLEQFSEPVRFMNIDCDIYSSTKTILELFAHRIISGTVLVFDEYIGNEGWREDEFKAFQEATVQYGWEYEYLGFSFCTKQVVVRIVQVLPSRHDCHGNAIHDQFAEPEFATAHKEDRGNVDAFLAIASQHAKQGHWFEVEAWLRRVLEIKPDYAEVQYNLGIALHEMGRLDEAAASYRKALEIKPDYVDAHDKLGGVLRNLGHYDDAALCYRKVVEIKPDYAEAHNNLGGVLRNLGHYDDAVVCYRRALQINPDGAEVHSNLGVALHDLGQIDDAVVCHRRALQIKPSYAEAYGNLGNALQDLGQLDDAIACYRRALGIRPDFTKAYSNMLFALGHSEAVDAQTLFAEHCRFAEQVENPLRARWPKHNNPRNPERSLRIGFVSGDLRNHAVMSFLEPVLAHLANFPQLSLHAYSNHVREDGVTQRIRGHVQHWNTIVGLSDDGLAQKIHSDGIDILIDLSGHTAHNRLLAFARKPAPVQVSWIGYAGTTGLCAMDYYLADCYLLPPGQFDGQFKEKLVYLPASLTFLPDNDAPSVNSLPALSNGYVTFGSFNRPNKISRAVVALWSQLLRALPSARMVLGAMPEAGIEPVLIDWFTQEGIVLERLVFYQKCPMKEYLGLYSQVDLCLDTFPYTGSTTTAHALWMGVPTLTLAGETVPSRFGASMLGYIGLEDLIAHSKTEFLAKGLQYATHLDDLTLIRNGLRARFEQSALGKPNLVAAALERAFRSMWKNWCAGLPVKSLDVSSQDCA